ncbi:Asp-tRNA(Asn)/Glu-tRNA(Gln) amidotransferase subunit GatC [Vagococcus silagei]|uniref:Aspartyl/glutamyl-tRNA(Asn/Gln) amidotransferase subunit C n=1 Tax=Vagococcus silagei TaxID=2508885 RepID=A0A4S3B6V4_9ENTE|nr:Asp-tRNA(Asn)/Glu-tRNA(Gln) amidotransferase subunit GatC [Vagococcus silagei]THB61690.1 Asp-tRNA(Asn)/Glu-tRNA(Gln) amidotransferase subunit GatC [Vagococcus silagei]
MAITKEEIQRVANLSKLAFNDQELEKFTGQMSEIIDMMATLDGVNTDDVAFTSNVASEHSVLREDKVLKGESRDELLKNVPETENGFIKVPVIIDNGEAGA